MHQLMLDLPAFRVGIANFHAHRLVERLGYCPPPSFHDEGVIMEALDGRAIFPDLATKIRQMLVDPNGLR